MPSFLHHPQLGKAICCSSCSFTMSCAINKTNSNHCCPCDSFVPSPLLIFSRCPPFPPSAQYLALFPSLSIHRSIHPRRRQARSFPPPHARSFPSLSFPSFLPSLPCPSLRWRAVPGPVPGKPGTMRIFFNLSLRVLEKGLFFSL